MSWRPKEGWENPYKPKKGILRLEGISRMTLNTAGQAYEAGADAMLEVLKAKGTHWLKAFPHTLVVIPDDQKEATE